MTQMTLEGLGLSTPPDYLVDTAIKEGHLVEILPQWHAADMIIYAVWPDNVAKNSLTSRFLNFMIEKKTGFLT